MSVSRLLRLFDIKLFFMGSSSGNSRIACCVLASLSALVTPSRRRVVCTYPKGTDSLCSSEASLYSTPKGNASTTYGTLYGDINDTKHYMRHHNLASGLAHTGATSSDAMTVTACSVEVSAGGTDPARIQRSFYEWHRTDAFTKLKYPSFKLYSCF